MLFGYPLFWYNKSQPEIDLSTTEAECISMSQELRNVALLVNLMSELMLPININWIKPTMKWKVFEDNQFSIAIANAPSILPRTKRVGLKYYHFR